uniref:Uncharacterized protein n=1 Tax=Aplanochytrium stocchinoi TaxID=215587 RepID=A0A7S3UZX3_9STRA
MDIIIDLRNTVYFVLESAKWDCTTSDESGVSDMFTILTLALQNHKLRERVLRYKTAEGLNGYNSNEEFDTSSTEMYSEEEIDINGNIIETQVDNCQKCETIDRNGRRIVNRVYHVSIWYLQHIQNRSIQRSASLMLLELLSPNCKTEIAPDLKDMMLRNINVALGSMVALAYQEYETEEEINLKRNRGSYCSIRTLAEKTRQQEIFTERHVKISDVVTQIVKACVDVNEFQVSQYEICKAVDATILPYIAFILSQRTLTGSPTIDRWCYRKAVTAMCWLSLSTPWVNCIVKRHFGIIIKTLNKSFDIKNEIGDLGRECQIQGLRINAGDESVLADACSLLHLNIRFLSSIVMYSTALSVIIDRNSNVINQLLLLFSSTCSDNNIDVIVSDDEYTDEDFIPLPCMPNKDGSDVASFCVGFNSALVAAKLEASFGKYILETSALTLGMKAKLNAEQVQSNQIDFHLYSNNGVYKNEGKQNRSKVCSWINQAVNVIVNCPDDHIQAKAANLIWNMLNTFGWIKVFNNKLIRDSSVFSKSTTVKMMRLWSWRNDVLNSVLFLLKQNKGIAGKREACRILEILVQVSSAETEKTLIAQFKFQDKELLNSENVGYRYLQGQMSNMHFWKVIGGPVHASSSDNHNFFQSGKEGYNHGSSIIENSNIWGVSFQNDDALCAENRIDGIVLGSQWSVSVWIKFSRKKIENNDLLPESKSQESLIQDPLRLECEHVSLCESGIVKTLLEMDNGFQPIAFSETRENTMELGCVFPQSNHNSNSFYWRGTGFALDDLMPGWHHLVAVVKDGKLNFIVDQIKVRKSINIVDSVLDNHTLKTIGNSSCLNYSTPLSKTCMIADLRVYDDALTENVVYTSPATERFNRRPWVNVVFLNLMV